MYLKSISLKNYRRFKSVELEFPDGIVGIIGNNGAGKSTLMEAIAWALFGTDASRTSKDQIKSISASKADVCRVILDFEMNGDNFEVVRELKGATHSVDASVIINKKVAARGNNPVNELIQRTLDMDYRAFMTSFYAKQRELNALSDFQPHKRKELLTRMLGIETVDTALRDLRLDKRDLEMRVELDRSRLKDKVELEAQRKEKSQNLNRLRDEHKVAKEKFNSATSGLKEVEKSWKELKAKQEEHTRLNQKSGIVQTEKRGLDAQLKSQDQERMKLLALDSESKRLQESLAQYEETKKRVDALDEMRVKAEQQRVTQSQTKDIETSLTKDRERLAVLRKELEPRAEIDKSVSQVKEKLVSAEKELEEKRNLYLRAEASSKSIGDEKAKLESQLKHVEKLGPDSVCDRCLRPMGSDYQDIRQHLLDEQNKIDEKLKSAEREKEKVREIGRGVRKTKIDLEEWKERLQKSVEEFSRLEGERENLERGVEEKKKNLSSLREMLKSLGEVEYDPTHHKRLKEEFERLEKLKQTLTGLASELKRLPVVEKNRKELTEKLQVLDREEAKLRESLLHLRFSEEEYKRAERNLEERRKSVHSTELTLKDIDHNIEMVGKEIDQIKGEIESAARSAQRITEWEQQRRYLERLDMLFSDFRISLIGRIRPTLSRYARTLFLDLCDNRYEDFELDEDYEIFVQDQGEKFPLSRFSGGETDLANLCLRVAISLLISESSQVDFSFIILDEIFGSQDLLRKESILAALARLKNRFRQMFLITHIDDIKDSVENLVYVTENEDGSSDLLLQ
ncbi:MAG: SMC family ATPase [Candidatus Zixiibacteriota bacterium]|nr:MAG: SMC family ATPase [candidate division Zixibacteria bacterium]